MKRTDVLQLVILIVAVFIGYQALIELPQMIWRVYKLIVSPDELSLYGFDTSASFLYFGLFLLIMILLVKNSRALGKYLADRTGFEAEISFSQSQTQLLTITFITMGVYMICTRAPLLLNSFYEAFKNSYLSSSDKANLSYSMPFEKMPVLIMQIISAMILVSYSKELSNYFLRAVQPVDEEHTIGNDLKEQ